MNSSMIAPVMALVAWSLVMWVWMYAQRIPAMHKAGVKPQDARFPGSLDILPDGARAAADNYNHLMEQPTVFYAVALALAIGGLGGGLNTQIAWAYVALRILHSIVQATVNRVMWRFGVFALASLALLALCVHAFIGFVVH